MVVCILVKDSCFILRGGKSRRHFTLIRCDSYNIVYNDKVNTLYFGFKLTSFRNNELINVDGLTVSKYVYRKTVQQRIGQQ